MKQRRNSKKKKKKKECWVYWEIWSNGCCSPNEVMLPLFDSLFFLQKEPFCQACVLFPEGEKCERDLRRNIWKHSEGLARWFTIRHSDKVKKGFSNYPAVFEAFSINQICIIQRSKINSFTFWKWILQREFLKYTWALCSWMCWNSYHKRTFMCNIMCIV